MASSLDYSSVLHEVIAIAHGAGEIIRRHHAAPVATTLKSSRIDVVTAADTETEQYIVRALLARYPTHHIVGEEGGGQGAPADTAPFHWYVDPIDGTVNFASKLPHFCTSIALASPDRIPQVAVVLDPVKGELFTAVREKGAWLNGAPIRVSQTAELIDAVVTTGFPYDKHTNPDNNLKEWGAFLRRIRGERRLGSAALDFAYLACGRVDGFWENDLKIWDAMAGALIAAEAGATVTDYRGNPNPQTRDRGDYMASNGRLHEEMLSVLRSVRG